MPTESSVIAATAVPITQSQIAADLRHIGITSGSVVLVHVSLSSLGWVIGGAQAVVEALIAAVGESGTVVMPAQSSQLSDPENWSNPPVPEVWFDRIREHMPAFDPYITPTRGIGAVAECLIRHPNSLRSSHPLASFVANGALARQIVGEHPLTPALGATSPLGRLYELDSHVLLLGVGHDRNTSLHLAEHQADWPSKRQRPEGAPVLKEGLRQWVTYDDLAVDDEDFEKIGDAFGATGLEQKGSVAQAACRLMKQRAIVDFGKNWITANRR